MPRKKPRNRKKAPQTPSYRRQRSQGTDRAFVVLNGQRHYLGPYGSAQSKQRYHALLAEWEAHGRQPRTDPKQITIVELCAAFMDHAEVYYRNADGHPGAEVANHRPALNHLLSLYETLPAAEFTPKCLKAVRQRMLDANWSRKYINRQIVRLRGVFKWAASEGLIEVDIYTALTTVNGLRRGRTEAAEPEPIGIVAEEQIEATCEHLPPIVRDMVYVQLYTGMRPGELCTMRAVDLEIAEPNWWYRPATHKTAYAGRERVIPIGPRAREILTRYMTGTSVTGYLFSPAKAQQQRRETAHRERKTPLSCGNRPGTNRKCRPQRAPRDHYTPVSYARAIRYACEKAFAHPTLASIPKSKLTNRQREQLNEWNTQHRWSPNQLRHTAATRIRQVAGLEVARAVLGHSTIGVTEQYYAEIDRSKCAEVIGKVG